MSRHHSNFIQAYVDQHKDGFVPNKFYLWSAISLVAAVLERKVWLPWGNINFYPNMYVFLVSKPGIGKSSAMRPNQKLIAKVNKDHQRLIRLLPNKVTEPKLLDILSKEDYFLYENTSFGHTSAYYIASEASTCFNDPYGGFTQTITALYDGDDISKATVSRPLPIKIENPCINLIAGCTFDYLSRLLTTEGILGGFASRITYVVQDETMDRVSTWQGDTKGDASKQINKALVGDLASINEMVGPFSADKDYQEAYDEWFPIFDKAYQQEPSEKLQALMVRKSTAMKKLPLILSASESSDRVLKLHHWNAALKLMNEVEEKIPAMIRVGQSANTETVQGRNSAIYQVMQENRNVLSRDVLIGKLSNHGINYEQAQSNLKGLLMEGGILVEKNGFIHLIGDPNATL